MTDFEGKNLDMIIFTNKMIFFLYGSNLNTLTKIFKNKNINNQIYIVYLENSITIRWFKHAYPPRYLDIISFGYGII
jgi:hypothetical protein